VKLRRIATVAVAATLAATGLTACRTNVGVAARVQGSTITESDVNTYLDPKGVASDVAAQAQSQNQTVSPRSEVLLWLIREQVFEKTLKRLNIPVSDGRLAAQHDDAGSALLQTQLAGAALDRQVEQELARIGIKKKFRAQVLRAQELELLLIKQRQMTEESQLTAAVKPAATKVSVGARYGKWDVKSLSLSSDPVLPSFVVPADSGA
jgi:hypothetical protein